MDKELSIFNQICQVNDLDPDKIRSMAYEQKEEKAGESENVEHLIRTAFNYRATSLVKKLELGTTTGSPNIKEGQEYSIGADPAAPSFTINEDFIHSKYSEDEAQRLIKALGEVMLPIRA